MAPPRHLCGPSASAESLVSPRRPSPPALNEIEESPWGDIHGKALTQSALARRLKRFAIRPRTIRLDDGTTPKGYPLDVFEDAFSRYLSLSDRHTDTTLMGAGFTADSQPPHAPVEKPRKPAPANACGDVPDEPAAEAAHDLRRSYWECPCGREPGRSTRPVRTVVSLREPACPFCGRAFRPEWMRPEPEEAGELRVCTQPSDGDLHPGDGWPRLAGLEGRP